MKSLTSFINEELKDARYINNVCHDFCEEGSWDRNNGRITPREVENIFDELKDYDFVKDVAPVGAQKLPLEKAQNLIRALASKKGVEKAYDEWKDGQSGAYWYQGYPRKEKLGYEVETALVVGMSKYLDMNIKDCYKTTSLSYDQLKTKFLNKKFEKEMLASFKR